MNKKVIIIALIVIVLGAIVSVSINRKPTNQETIKVGVILPLSGQYAALGESDRNAMLLAQEELQADNIELFFEDDKYDARTAVTAYHKLKSINDIDALVVLSAPSIQSIAPLTNADKIPLLGLGATNVYEKDSVFQLMPTSNQLFPELGRMYGEKYKIIAIAHSSATLFADNTKAFRSGLPADVKAPDFIINPSTDYRTEVQKILAIKPEAVTLFMPKEDALKFLQALRVQDQKGQVKIVCDFGVEIAPNEYAQAIGKERLEGCISTNIPETPSGDFKERYKNKYNSELQITADYAHDSIQLIYELNKTSPKSEWINKLASPEFSFRGNASGEIVFTPDGTRVDMPPTLRIYKNGEFVPYSI